MMALVLAIEPDGRQAAILKQLVREQVPADLVVSASKDAALALAAERVPDLVLVSALMSPGEEAELTAHLRGLEDAQHLQTLTIPLLASKDTPASRKRKLLGGLKRGRGARKLEGCAPGVFAEEIRGYLERAREIREQRALDQDPPEPVAEPPVDVPPVQELDPLLVSEGVEVPTALNPSMGATAEPPPGDLLPESPEQGMPGAVLERIAPEPEEEGDSAPFEPLAVGRLEAAVGDRDREDRELEKLEAAGATPIAAAEESIAFRPVNVELVTEQDAGAAASEARAEVTCDLWIPAAIDRPVAPPVGCVASSAVEEGAPRVVAEPPPFEPQEVGRPEAAVGDRDREDRALEELEAAGATPIAAAEAAIEHDRQPVERAVLPGEDAPLESVNLGDAHEADAVAIELNGLPRITERVEPLERQPPPKDLLTELPAAVMASTIPLSLESIDLDAIAFEVITEESPTVASDAWEPLAINHLVPPSDEVAAPLTGFGLQTFLGSSTAHVEPGDRRWRQKTSDEGGPKPEPRTPEPEHRQRHVPAPRRAYRDDWGTPLALWVHCEGSEPEPRLATTDLQALLGGLLIAADIAAVAYPAGCRIRNVRVPPTRAHVSDKRTIIVSRRMLRKLRRESRAVR